MPNSKSTVADLVRFLLTQPQDAIVQVGVKEQCGWTEITEYQDIDVPTEENPYTEKVNVIDLRGNPFITEDNANFNKVFIQLGDL